jgi:hypothetical protein
MRNTLKILLVLMICISVSTAAPIALAQTTVPHPFVDFSGIFLVFLPVCLNGALVVVATPIPILLLFPYVPITPIVPVFKLWGPIPGAATIGNFLPGGVCFVPVPGLFGTVVIPVPTFGTLVQIGTSLVPQPFIPQQI